MMVSLFDLWVHKITVVIVHIVGSVGQRVGVRLFTYHLNKTYRTVSYPCVQLAFYFSKPELHTQTKRVLDKISPRVFHE